MGDFFFFIKMIVFTFAFMMIMQAKVGSRTVEQKVLDWTHKSEVALMAKKVAEGAIAATGQAYKSLKDQASQSQHQTSVKEIKEEAQEKLEDTFDETKNYIDEKAIEMLETENL